MKAEYHFPKPFEPPSLHHAAERMEICVAQSRKTMAFLRKARVELGRCHRLYSHLGTGAKRVIGVRGADEGTVQKHSVVVTKPHFCGFLHFLGLLHWEDVRGEGGLVWHRQSSFPTVRGFIAATAASAPATS